LADEASGLKVVTVGSVAEEDVWGWGGPVRMSAWEALMWRGEEDPRTRSSAVLLEILDSEPDWDRLVAALDRATRLIPRLRDRVVEPALPVGSPVWTEDTHFDLSYHLRRIRLPEPGGMAELLDLTAHVAGRPLDRNRPPWEALLVGGLEGGGAAYVFKLHHSLSDGLGLVQLLGMLHSRTAEPGGQPIASTGPAPQREPGPAPTSVGLVAEQLWANLADLPRHAAGGVGAAVGLIGRVLHNPGAALTKTLDYGLSLRRVLSPPQVGRSPLLSAGSGFSYRVLVHEMRLDEVKAAGKAVGGSVNDVFLAGVLGAFRRYQEHFGQSIAQLPVSLPISLRDSADPTGGNRWAGARLALPVGEPDPGLRIQLIREIVLAVRREPAIAVMDVLAPALNRLPSLALSPIVSAVTNVADVQASNVPGLAFPVYVAGARVRRIYAIGPRPGVTAMISMVTYDGICCLGLNVDPDSIVDVAAFETCLHEGFDEVLALGR
jgi:WS/DGAT/MGAT family acyltransferase